MSNSQNTSLIEMVDGVPFTTSEIVAEHAGIEHRAALQLLETHQSSIEDAFGQVAFEMRTGYNNAKVRVARLTEEQSTSLLTLMRNTPAVVGFKINLVKAFSEATKSTVVALPSRAALAQMVLDAEKEIEAAKMQAELDAPKIRYHERFVAEMDDVQTIDMFATDWGTTGPKVRELLRTKGVAVRRILGRRWSKSKQRMVDVPEWRPRQGTRYSEWFVVRPQHDAPRHHNGQVRTTMYLLRFHAEDLAQKLGLKEPAMFDGGDAA
ncbi:phage antirepressor KilAC domain-containing protein [Brevibacterium sp. BDJS002]|uniref:Rha family transcriptional regulator n=1 Tax=Brevibacterium sp. BDJS002 TaxID=3020906 RepID=UPI0023074F93|nr:Rha family transcriptional regulator [Brevibacterium sp. BDJS002]WCE39164.1 phage antirepressor KilAC domain-containing protein [Brevibacterium sp. BDJS002]